MLGMGGRPRNKKKNRRGVGVLGDLLGVLGGGQETKETKKKGLGDLLWH